MKTKPGKASDKTEHPEVAQYNYELVRLAFKWEKRYPPYRKLNYFQQSVVNNQLADPRRKPIASYPGVNPSKPGWSEAMNFNLYGSKPDLLSAFWEMIERARRIQSIAVPTAKRGAPKNNRSRARSMKWLELLALANRKKHKTLDECERSQLSAARKEARKLLPAFKQDAVNIALYEGLEKETQL